MLGPRAAPFQLDLGTTQGMALDGLINVEGEALRHAVVDGDTLSISQRGLSPKAHFPGALVTGPMNAPFKMSVDSVLAPATEYATSGQLLIVGETLTYDQNSQASACAGLNTVTQFCVTARGVAALHATGAVVYQKP